LFKLDAKYRLKGEIAAVKELQGLNRLRKKDVISASISIVLTHITSPFSGEIWPVAFKGSWSWLSSGARSQRIG
jgi:hypothetical protein